MGLRLTLLALWCTNQQTFHPDSCCQTETLILENFTANSLARKLLEGSRSTPTDLKVGCWGTWLEEGSRWVSGFWQGRRRLKPPVLVARRLALRAQRRKTHQIIGKFMRNWTSLCWWCARIMRRCHQNVEIDCVNYRHLKMTNFLDALASLRPILDSLYVIGQTWIAG